MTCLDWKSAALWQSSARFHWERELRPDGKGGVKKALWNNDRCDLTRAPFLFSRKTRVVWFDLASTGGVARRQRIMHCPVMRAINYCVYKDGPFYVSQCLNVDVSSFGDTADHAVANLKEAVELYFENPSSADE